MVCSLMQLSRARLNPSCRFHQRSWDKLRQCTNTTQSVQASGSLTTYQAYKVNHFRRCHFLILETQHETMHWMLMFSPLLNLFYISIVSASDSTLSTVVTSASVTLSATTTSSTSTTEPSESAGLPTGSQPSTQVSLNLITRLFPRCLHRIDNLASPSALVA